MLVLPGGSGYDYKPMEESFYLFEYYLYMCEHVSFTIYMYTLETFWSSWTLLSSRGKNKIKIKIGKEKTLKKKKNIVDILYYCAL